MFWLHETTRTWFCRAAFVALCLVPACGVVAWCVVVHLPSYRHARQREIGERLGWHAQLASASTPRPGLCLYEGLELSDPRSDQLLARVPFVEVETSGNNTTLRLPFPLTINALRLDALLASAERIARAADGSRNIELSAGTVTLHASDADHTLVDVKVNVERGDGESRMTGSFRLATADETTADADPSAPATFTLVHTGGPQDQCAIEFSTGGTPLPCRLIAGSWSTAGRLGKTATFDGQLTATRASGMWQLNLSGRGENIDLASLLASFPHKLTGSAEVKLDHATISAGRLQSAAGTLVAGPGTISRSLVHAAENSLALEVSRQAYLGRTNRLPYRELNVAFDVDATGLALRGELAQGAGALLVDDNDVLARQPSVERQPVVNLLRALVPQTAVQVPATRETAPLAAFLPLPPIVPPPGSEEPLPQARSIRVQAR